MGNLKGNRTTSRAKKTICFSQKKIPSKRKKTNDSDRVIQNLQNIMEDISDKRQVKKQKMILPYLENLLLVN